MKNKIVATLFILVTFSSSQASFAMKGNNRGRPGHNGDQIGAMISTIAGAMSLFNSNAIMVLENDVPLNYVNNDSDAVIPEYDPADPQTWVPHGGITYSDIGEPQLVWDDTEIEENAHAAVNDHSHLVNIAENQRIRFVPEKAKDTEWTIDNIGDSDHDGFIISVKKAESEESLTIVCLNMMAFTTRKYTYKVPDVNDENNITQAEADAYKERLNRIAKTLSQCVVHKKNLVFVFQEIRQSNLNGKYISDEDKDANTEFRDAFIDALKYHSKRDFLIFSKPTITNTFSNMIVVEMGLIAAEIEDLLPEFDELLTGEVTRRPSLVESGHALYVTDSKENKRRPIKTQKDRAIGVEINGIAIYGIHLIHRKGDMANDYDTDLKTTLTKIFNREKEEKKPIIIVGDFNYDFEQMHLPLDGIKMGCMPLGALEGKGEMKTIDGYIASSNLSID